MLVHVQIEEVKRYSMNYIGYTSASTNYID